MKIIVCVKQVPDTSGKVAVKADGTLDRASMATITNPDDLSAVEAAMAKLWCSEHAMKTTTKALQMFGGYGYTKDYPMERMMRDAKITEIYEGTSEVQRIVISANMGL